MKAVEWCLRLAVFGTFFGHGMIAVLDCPAKWRGYIELFGIAKMQSDGILLTIGIIDIILAVSLLIKPIRAVIIYCFVWALITALMRPIAGEGILQFVERSANFLAPLALYFVVRYQEKMSATN